MKTQIIKIIKYKGCPIYIRRIGCHFEFLVAIRRKIHSEYIDLVPEWYKSFNEEPFSKEDIHKVSMVLIGMAKNLVNNLKK